MKLGKVLDLSKCVYDKDHWTHSDLKEGQLYLVKYIDLYKLYRYMRKTKFIRKLGTFTLCPFGWVFNAKGYSSSKGPHILYFHETDKISPIQSGWKHIQEVIV